MKLHLTADVASEGNRAAGMNCVSLLASISNFQCPQEASPSITLLQGSVRAELMLMGVRLSMASLFLDTGILYWALLNMCQS